MRDPPIRHRLNYRGNRRINSDLYIASVTQERDHKPAQDYLTRKPKAKPVERPGAPTNANSPTVSSAECGETNKPDRQHFQP